MPEETPAARRRVRAGEGSRARGRSPVFVALGALVVVLIACRCPAIAQPGDASKGSATEAFRQYMAALEKLRDRWRRSAELFRAGKVEQALALMDTEVPPELPQVYRRQQAALGSRLKRVSHRSSVRKDTTLAWLYRKMEAPALGVEVFKACLERTKDMTKTFDISLDMSGCLVDAGRFEEARTELSRLAPRGGARRDVIAKRIALLGERIAEGAPGLPFFRGYYADSGAEWYPGRLGPILDLWRLQPLQEQEPDKILLMAELFGKYQDSGGKTLALEAVAELPGAGSEEAAGALLEAGNDLSNRRESDRAMELWGRIIQQHAGTKAWGKAVFNTGIVLKEQRKYRQAVATFEKLFDSDVDDREQGGHIMETYRNYRHRACLEISTCHESLGDKASALKYALLARDGHTYQTWCGTCAKSGAQGLDGRVARLGGHPRPKPAAARSAGQGGRLPTGDLLRLAVGGALVALLAGYLVWARVRRRKRADAEAR